MRNWIDGLRKRWLFARDHGGLKITITIEEHLSELRFWFRDQTACYQWGGPLLRFPHTTDSFRKDILWGRVTSWSGVDETGRLAAFGQYYLLDDRCHLARLAVNPQLRQRGLGARFITGLIDLGARDLGVGQSSLFVVRDNIAARTCYHKLGFEMHPWPAGREPLPDVLFMVRTT